MSVPSFDVTLTTELAADGVGETSASAVDAAKKVAARRQSIRPCFTVWHPFRERLLLRRLAPSSRPIPKGVGLTRTRSATAGDGERGLQWTRFHNVKRDIKPASGWLHREAV